jgi:hypothetical protein
MQDEYLAEKVRVRQMVDDALAEIATEGGNVRLFGAALLVLAIQVHAELEGTDGLDRAIAGIAKRELVRLGKAAQC